MKRMDYQYKKTKLSTFKRNLRKNIIDRRPVKQQKSYRYKTGNTDNKLTQSTNGIYFNCKTSGFYSSSKGFTMSPEQVKYQKDYLKYFKGR